MGPPPGHDLRAAELTADISVDPTDLRRLEELLARRNFRPVHRLGQNFLVDGRLRDRVAELSGITSGDRVLEVGSGPGALTVRLVEMALEVIAVELDKRLLAVLGDVLPDRPNLRIVGGDILKIKLPAVDVVAGNIPYYLTGALLPRLLEGPQRPRTVSLVVQREVAERWTQQGDWSLATVAVQTLAIPRLELVLPREAFWPEPAVESALVVLEVREKPAVDVPDLNAFFRFVEVLFQFRRKQLGSTLARRAGPGPAVAARLESIGIDPSRRAQTLTLPEWEALYGEFGLGDGPRE